MKMTATSMFEPWKYIERPSVGLIARRIDDEHPLNLFWARDIQNRYLFVYESSREHFSTKLALPNLQGIQIHVTAPLLENERQQLLLILKDNSNWEVFLCLCSDIVEVTRANGLERPVETIVRRLQVWQELLRSKREQRLSLEEILGLTGELYFLERILAPVYGIASAVQAWKGPEGHSQDFSIDKKAIEVKSCSGTNSSSIRISSENQLFCPGLDLYLGVLVFEPSSTDMDDSFALPELTSSIRSRIFAEQPEAVESFNQKLFSTGYVDSDAYLDYRFALVGIQYFCVVDGFPRILPDSLAHGVVNLSYSIELSACGEFRCESI